MIDCPDVETIGKYVRGELSAEESTRFEIHSNGCPHCNTKTRELRQSLTARLEANVTTADHMPDVSNPNAGNTRRIVTAAEAQSYLGQQYKVIKKVGEGASGEVFLAIDAVLERSVAVKFLNKATRIAQEKQMALREGRVMSKLSHPNVAQIYQIGQSEGVQYIVMEWVEGVHITEAWRNMPLQSRLKLYLEVLKAIEAAHRRNIIHRDIKPSNILVTASGRAKVLDFGLAIDVYSLSGSDTKAYQGTPAYSAPEQISRPAEICAGTDVFSLGILLYQLLTDELPFPQHNLQDLFKAICSSHPELPTAIQETIPIPLQNICLKALEKDIGNRYQDGHALASDITRYLKGEKVWSRPTFLENKIQEEVHYHDQRLSVWRTNDLITEREHDKLRSIYDRVVTPSDPSIIESRKLSFSQVSLYLGGWLTVLGSAVVLLNESNVANWVRPIPSLLAVLFMLICGRLLWGNEDRRLAVGFLATGNLLLPVASIIALAYWGILSPVGEGRYFLGTEPLRELQLPQQADPSTLTSEDSPEGTESFKSPSLAQSDNDIDPVVLGNWHLLISSLLWLVCSLYFVRISRSSIFVIFAILAFFLLLTAAFLTRGMIGGETMKQTIVDAWSPDKTAGRYLFSALGLFALGTFLDRRTYTKYAWPLCAAGLVTIVISLSAIANSERTLFGWLWPPIEPAAVEQPDSEPPPERWHEKEWLEDDTKLLSFCCNGIFYLTLATFCRRQKTRLQRTLAQVFDWLGPLHILGPLRALDDTEGLSLERILLPVASVAFILASVVRQMKSFFFSGLLGIAASVQKITYDHFRYRFSWPIGLVVSGILCMVFSWWLPQRRAAKELKPKVSGTGE